MNIPTFPTDNLYKFSALFGTVIILVSLYVPETLILKIHKQQSVIELKSESVKIEAKHLEKRVKEAIEIIKNTVNRQKGVSRANPEKVELSYSEDEIKALMRENEIFIKEIELKNVETNYNLNELKRLTDELRMVFLIRIFSFIFGILLAFFGYYQWYFKIQQYQDKILKNSVNQ